jgi:hypothetical protein
MLQWGNTVTQFPASDYGVRLDLLLKTQREIVEQVLPALHRAIGNVTNFMYEPDKDDEEIHAYLRELATETVIDELVSLLTREEIPASKRRAVVDVDGLSFDTLIACHSELAPDHVQAWYAQRAHLSPEAYTTIMNAIPAQMKL